MKEREKNALRILLGGLGAVLCVMLCLVPAVEGRSFAALIPALFGAYPVLSVLMALLLAGSAVSAAVWFVRGIGVRDCARITAVVNVLLLILLGVVSWLCVSAVPLLPTAEEGVPCAFSAWGYVLMGVSAVLLALVLRLRLERIVKRDAMAIKWAMLIRAAAILSALVVSMLMILMIGYDPLAVFAQIYKGSVGSQSALLITLERSIPLVLCTLAVIVAFRMHFWNVGVAGQLVVGAICAAFFAYNYATVLPHWLLIALMFIAGAVGGALYGLLPAIAKVKWGTNETLFALMLNYVATYLVQFLRRGPWEDPMMPSFGQCAMFNANARLTKVLGVSSGWIAALVILCFVAVYLRHTKQGFEITVVGEQSRTAQYVGIRVSRVILRTMLLSGAIAGIAGMLKISGADFKLNETIAGDSLFSAITIAWLAKLSPVPGTAVALVFSALMKGCESLSMSTTLRVNGVSIPSASATVIIGIILLFVLGCEFFISYRMILRKEGGVSRT